MTREDALRLKTRDTLIVRRSFRCEFGTFLRGDVFVVSRADRVMGDRTLHVILDRLNGCERCRFNFYAPEFEVEMPSGRHCLSWWKLFRKERRLMEWLEDVFRPVPYGPSETWYTYT